MKPGATRVAGLWGATLLCAAVFLASGLGKLAAVAPMPQNFPRWGYPGRFLYLIGAVEARRPFPTRTPVDVGWVPIARLLRSPVAQA